MMAIKLFPISQSIKTLFRLAAGPDRTASSLSSVHHHLAAEWSGCVDAVPPLEFSSKLGNEMN